MSIVHIMYNFIVKNINLTCKIKSVVFNSNLFKKILGTISNEKFYKW